MKEIFKDIPGYEGLYQVSNLGKVKSLRRKIYVNSGFYLSVEKILKQSISIRGYYLTTLTKNNKSITKSVHSLVAMAFLDHTPNGNKIVVDHIDNNKKNNRLENLQIITHRENVSKDKKNKTSKYTGVSWDKVKNKWRSAIRLNEKNIYLGMFESEERASDTYQNKIKEYESM